MENVTYHDKPFYIVDVTIVMGPQIETTISRHLDERAARADFTDSVSNIIDDKFLVRLIKVSASGRFEEIARYHSTH